MTTEELAKKCWDEYHRVTGTERFARFCALCGADEPAHGHARWYPNRRGEDFCAPYHRARSNALLAALIASQETV